MRDLLSLPARETRELLVAFADIHGYTRHARRVDDQALAGELNDYYELVDDEASRADGLVVKYIGDSTLAVFNDVSTGVDGLLSLKERADDWLKRHGWQRASLNVKAHFDRVVVGPFGPAGRERFDVIGSAVNFTARMSSPGLSLSPPTFRKLSPQVRRRFKKHTPPVTYMRVEDRH